MKRALLVIVLAVTAVVCAAGQEVSERQEIAVFGLSYYDYSIPGSALGAIDQKIQEVFVNLGRFDVLGMNYRLTADDVSEFIDKISELKESSVELPEEVLMGHETFTEADLNKLIGSFIVVIPSVSFFNAEYSEGDYDVTLETSFSFVNVQDSKAIGQFSIETTGYDENKDKAVKDAVDSIPTELQYEVRSLEPFKLKTGILETLPGGKAIIEFGSNMGVTVGDEYAIVRKETLSTGHEIKKEIGLLIISEVNKEVSKGDIIYSQDEVVPGDQLEEIPRKGFDSTVYAHAFVDSGGYGGLLLGVQQSYFRGLKNFFPFVGVELPLVQSGAAAVFTNYFPANVYVGGGLKWHLWRLELAPAGAIGMGTQIPIREGYETRLSHFGGLGQVQLRYLANKSLRVFADAGYTYWMGMDVDSSYGGPFAGIGAIIRY